MKIAIGSILLLITFSGCQFSKSVKKNLVSGLLTTGNNLSCENVYLSVNDEETDRNTYIYGEKLNVNFNGIEGFRKENDNAFPGMKLFVTGKAADTVFQTNDLSSEFSTGLNLSPLLLIADVTVASPMKSGSEYTLHVNIWDKKGTGTFSAKLDFNIEANKTIVVEAEKVTCDEIYLFSKERNRVIPNDKIKMNENTYFIFEGLSGFKDENGMVFPGLGIKGTDKNGDVVFESSDLFSDYSETGLAVSDFKDRISSNFILTGSEFNNPLHCELTIWDKKSDARINVTADLTVE